MKLILSIISAIFIVYGQDSCFKDNCKFDKYTALINKAEKEYKECTRPNTCDCLNQSFKDDLAIFSEGIDQNDFENARSFGVHYQIIDGKLYRQEKCLFAFRCSGVEHFISSVINQIPDCEFILNDRDYPQSLKSHRPLPIFSFSKTLRNLNPIPLEKHSDLTIPLIRPIRETKVRPAISESETDDDDPFETEEPGPSDIANLDVDSFLQKFCKTKDYADIMYPAWSFWEGGPAISLYPTGIGRWDLTRNGIKKHADVMSFKKKVSKAFFRGSRTNSERDPLILLSRRSPDLVNAQYTKNQAWKSDADTLGQPAAKEVSFEDHCSYKYLFNFRGVAASFRFRHLFLCRSLVFHVDEEWVEFFYTFLKPWIHYVPVSQDLKDVEVLITYFRKNEAVAEKIAQRGFEWIYKYLTIENIECYWRRMLRQYARLLNFEVKRNHTLIQITN